MWGLICLTLNHIETMKKTHFLLVIFMLTSSLLVTACNRSDSDNPADSGSGSGTATGSGTMSAKIDGQNWTATSVSAAYTGNTLGNTLVIVGNQVQGTSAGTVTINITNVTGTGEFRLGLAPGVGGAQGFGGYGTAAGSTSTAQGWVTTNTETGTVNITRFDTQNKIVAGTFSFRCRSANATPEIRNITEGRFDARWQ